MMEYVKFYRIAKYLNDINRNTFTEEEVSCNAYDYICEYEESIENNKPTCIMIALCEQLTDKDLQDMDIATMNEIFEEVMEYVY